MSTTGIGRGARIVCMFGVELIILMKNVQQLNRLVLVRLLAFFPFDCLTALKFQDVADMLINKLGFAPVIAFAI